MTQEKVMGLIDKMFYEDYWKKQKVIHMEGKTRKELIEEMDYSSGIDRRVELEKSYREWGNKDLLVCILIQIDELKEEIKKLKEAIDDG